MPPKKRDLAAEKAAKQKKLLFVLIPFAAVAFYFFLIPTLTKGTPGPPPATAAAGTETTPAVVTPTGTPAPTAVATPVSATSGALNAPSYSFTANEGQLKRFSGHLKSKDPFAGTPSITVQTVDAPVVKPKPPTIPGGSNPGSGGGSTPVGTGTTTTPTGTPAAPYIYAVVTVNGVSEGVSLSDSFPAEGPLFHLDAIGAKSIKFSLLAGTFANGVRQITLLKGHKLTLRNTADGSRFVIELVTTSRAMPAAPTTSTKTSTSVLL